MDAVVHCPDALEKLDPMTPEQVQVEKPFAKREA